MKDSAFLKFHDYSFYEYEKALARLEVEQYIGVKVLEVQEEGLVIQATYDEAKIDRLTYFKSLTRGDNTIELTQKKLEGLKKQKRQSTRYSAHGIHEYKGKFNPQIVRAILNIHNIQEGQYVLDPFCGSGTTLLESTFSGLNVAGVDINPLATFIARAKLDAVKCDTLSLKATFSAFIKNYSKEAYKKVNDERSAYLESWFPEVVLMKIEKMKSFLDRKAPEEHKNLIKVLISDTIKDFSNQDPADLRIRRRKDVITNFDIDSAVIEKFAKVVGELENSNYLFKTTDTKTPKIVNDNIADREFHNRNIFDAQYDIAVTSPPYATALPYIDTQRLSLVWLGLLTPQELRKKEASLIGTREFNSDRNLWVQRLNGNTLEISEKFMSTA